MLSGFTSVGGLGVRTRLMYTFTDDLATGTKLHRSVPSVHNTISKEPLAGAPRVADVCSRLWSVVCGTDAVVGKGPGMPA